MTKNLSKEELLAIASAVLRGERPQSDLDLYGITLTEPISGDYARQMLFAELDGLEAADNSPPGESD